MVVPDAYRRLILRKYKQVVVDSKTGILHIAKDIRNQMMYVSEVSIVLLLVGRADVLSNNNK